MANTQPKSRSTTVGSLSGTSTQSSDVTSSTGVLITDMKVDEKNLKKKPTNAWLNLVYQQALMTDEELTNMYELIKYKGFDRDEMLAQMEEKIINPKLTAEVIMVCSLRGPRQAENVILSNGRTLKQMGIPASDQKGTTNISCQRISSATADLAAFFFKRIGIPKRLLSSELPGWLQFPTAGSIKMPDNYRQLHLNFAKEFSKRIGGEFNEQIYSQMMDNAYLDPKLNLFSV